jgi:outer membrane lipoprotein-sorting protein
VKISLALCCTLLLLPACVPHPPKLPYDTVPAAPLVRSLEEHRARVASLKALARVETENRGKRRAYESVAVVQRDFERLRVEGYGPLGQTLFTLLWDGTAMVLLPSDGSGMRTIGPEGLARVVGVSLEPGDLCALLVGTAPRVPAAAGAAAGCSTDGRCAVDIPEGDARWRVHMALRPVEAGGPEIEAIERYRGGTLIFLARYEDREQRGSASLPKRVVVHDPSKRVTLTIEYLDAEINVEVADGMFTPGGPEGGAP